MSKELGSLLITLDYFKLTTTKPLIDDIEIILNNGLSYVASGIVDTGADITLIYDKLCDKDGFGNVPLNKSTTYPLLELQFYQRKLFYDELQILEIGIFQKGVNNPSQIQPDLLLGRDFLKKCEMLYSGLENKILIKGFSY
jgi:hypothetical protein